MRKEFIRFVIPVLIQIGILAAIPAIQIYILSTGKSITLKTAPVDPYTILSGYYVNLYYEISNPRNLPGFSDGKFDNGDDVYTLLSPDNEGIWMPKAVYKTEPIVTAGTAIIRGRFKNRWIIEYGIEAYYIPEKAREEITRKLWKQGSRIFVDVAVTDSGKAAIKQIRMGTKTYSF